MPNLYPKWMYEAAEKYKKLCEEAYQLRVHLENEVEIYHAESGMDRDSNHVPDRAWEELGNLQEYSEQLRKHF